MSSKIPESNGVENPPVKLPLGKSILTLEPALTIHMTATVMIFMVVQDFLLEKACRINLGHSDQVCDAVELQKSTAFENEEKEIQKLIGTVMMYRAILENAFPIFLVFFIGAWSDKYGRKLPILLVILAYLIQNILLILCVYLKESAGVWTVALASSLVVSLSGNEACLMVCVFSYVSDNASAENITIRTGITHMANLLGITFGLVGGGILSKSKLGFEMSFLIGVGLETFAFIYILIMMTNQTQPGITQGKTNGQIIMELFDLNHVKDSAHTIIKKREGNDRLKFGLLLFAHSCTIIPIGEIGVRYLFCRLQFDWDAGSYGFFMTYKLILSFFSSFISMGLLTQLLKLSDPVNGIVACTGDMISSILFAFATTPTMMYIAPLATILSGAANIVPRATIATIIPANEQGKVNSFIGSLESITPLIAGFLYTSVYKSFLEVLPGSFFLISASAMVCPIFIYLWLIYDAKSQTPTKKQN